MLEILIAYIKATFENSMPNITEVQGLAEKITEGDTQFPALYCTGGEYKHLSALENYLYFRQTGSATEEESEEESTSGCAYMIRRTYPMVAVAYIPKSVYNTDNAFIDGKIAQNIANIITKANWQSLGVTLKTENIYAEVGEINTDRHSVWASEYRGVEFAARLDHVFVSVEFDIIVEASELCLQNYDCNDVEVEVNGDTIIVEITDPDAWHQTGDALADVKKIGSTTNVNWQIIHNGLTIATVTANGIVLNSSIVEKTVAQAQALIAANGLVPGQIYAITDATSANGGSGVIYLEASTVNAFGANGTWGRPTDLKAFGWIDVTAMIAGNDITAINVNGVNQLSGTITFNTSINNTVSLAVANINANGAATVTAVAVRDRLILINKIATSSVNTHVIVGAGTATFDNEVTMDYGQEPDTFFYNCSYDITTDEIYACLDSINNIGYRVTSAYITTLGTNPIYSFRWEDNSLAGANPWANTYIENQDFAGFYYRETDLTGSVYKAAATVSLDGAALINSYISRANFISGTYDFSNMIIRGIASNYLEIYEGEYINSTVTAADLTSSGRWLFPRILNAATVTCTGLNIGVSGLLEMVRMTVSAASTVTLTNVTITNTKISLKEVLLTQNSTINFTGSTFNGGEFAGSSSEIINNSTLTLTSMTVTANFQFNSNKIGGRSTLTFTGSTISTTLLFQYNIVGGNTSLNYTNLVTGVHAFTFTGNILNGTTINNTGTTMTGALSYTNAVYTLAAALSTTPGMVTSGGGYTLPGNANLLYSGRGLIAFTANGRIRISNINANDFDLLQFGGTSSSFPALKRASAELQARLANDGGYAVFDAASYKVGGVAGFTGTFLDQTGKTVTVVGGIITSVV